MATFQEFLSSFDLDNDKKGKQFEHFVKWFLKNDPEWSTQVDEVWMLDEYPDSWGGDLGVDLVFKHKNGEIWAVQAKCYDTKYSVKKTDIDSFLSESNRSIIDKRLLIASTDKIGGNARKVCQGQEKPVTFYLYSDFEKAAIDYPSDISQLSSAKRKELPTPRPHQIKAIEDVTRGFESADRGQMIMACGTGKTFTTLWVKEALNAKTTLVLLPSLSLLSQTLWEWTSASNTPFEALCVCSDEKVGKKVNTDEMISSVQDVAFPTTSDPQVIKSFLDRDVSKVIFSTYHSSPSIAEAQSGGDSPVFDLVVADEAHRCTGEAGTAFTTVLDSSLIKANRRLFTTATPKTYSANLKTKASEVGIDITDMSDESSFGKVFHNLTFGQAIKDKLLTDYRVVVIAVDEPMISKWIERRELVKTDTGETTDAKTLASQIGLIKAIKDYDLKRMISFHSKVKGAELFANELHNAIDFVSDEHRPEGEIYTDYVSGKMSSYERGRKIKKLKELSCADRGLLTNARCLSEGIDVPSLDGIAFIDPRSSKIDIVQAVGRAIRDSDDKTIGTIILPVFMEDTDDVEDSLQSSNFKPIWDVLNALKSHDETLSLELDQFRTNQGRQPGGGSVGGLPDKIIFDLPTTIDKSFSDALKTIVIDKTTDSWEFWYGLLLNYFDENCHSIVPKSYKTKDEYNLGSWVGNQRNSDKITKIQIKKLDSLGFVWNTHEYAWNKGFNNLQKFVDEYQHPVPVGSYKSKDGYKLGAWIIEQRQSRENNKLTNEQIEKLNSLGFVWNARGEHLWDKGFNHLREFVREKGHSLVKRGYVNDKGYALSRWVNQQRTAYIKGKLAKQQIEKLDLLGFVWNVHEYNWNEGFNHLKEFKYKNGHTSVLGRYHTNDNFSLGSWVSTQRLGRKKDKLTIEQIEKLDSLEFVWDMREYAWNQGFNHLKEYVAVNKDALVPQTYETDNGYKLGFWVSTQRRLHSNGTLDSNKVEQLRNLNDWRW